MNNIETIICLIMLFMAVPDLCNKLGRPSLIYSVFVLFGLVLGPLVDPGVTAMLTKAGEVGFLLLLFEVGLEIALPRFREFVPPLKYSVAWLALQYPVLLALGLMAGLSLPEGMLGTAALLGCSVGMAHAGWKTFNGFPDEATRTLVLRVMVALELLAIVLLTVFAVALEKGFHWLIVVRLVGITATILLISRFTAHLVSMFQKIVEKTTHWRVHLMVLLVFAVCAIGERLGLSAAKTAFVLGLFMSRARHNGMNLEDYMAPISKRLLIPIFFVTLGAQVPWQLFFTRTAILALGAAFFIIGFREMMHRRLLKTGGAANTYLLFCPNLTMVALAATALLKHGSGVEVTGWLVMTGLFLTVATLWLLPASREQDPQAVSQMPDQVAAK